MATGAPGTNGVWQYGEDDSEATFSALLNKVAATTDTQIGTDRGRLTTLEARKLSGLVPIIPPTVNYSGGTATANSLGVITFTNVTSISLNSVFTSDYTHYEIKTQNTNFSAGNNLQYRMRASGTDSTANTYYTEGLAVRLATTTLYGGLATNGYIHSTYALSGAFSSSTIKLSNPAKAQYTTGNVEAQSLWSDGGSYGGFSGIIHQTATAYDGITLYPATGTMTGTVQVYGYKE
jgi:hypothetical protein